MAIRRWVFNVLVSIDQLGNTLAGGDPDETISSRTAKACLQGKTWGRVGCAILDWFDPGHCQYSLEPDEGGKALYVKRTRARSGPPDGSDGGSPPWDWASPL
jgi:hypothetical protein